MEDLYVLVITNKQSNILQVRTQTLFYQGGKAGERQGKGKGREGASSRATLRDGKGEQLVDSEYDVEVFQK